MLDIILKYKNRLLMQVALETAKLKTRFYMIFRYRIMLL
jgi:hypothetical protein